MGSKFLSSGGGDLAALQDGSLALNVSSAIIQTLTPSYPVKTSATKELVSGLISLADCSFVPITNPMAVDLDMGNNDITDVTSLLLTSNPTPATPPIGMLTLYESGDKLRYKNSSAATFQVATNTDLGSYLALAGGTMTGSINMGVQNITNVTAIRPATTNIIYGNNTTIGVGATNNTLIGNNTTTGFGADTNVLIGESASLNATTAGNVVIGTLAASTLGGNSVIVGQQSQARGNAVSIGKEAVAGASAVVVGYRSSSGINTDSVVLGHDNTSSGTSADILGINRTNNQPNSLLLGNGSYTNIRANTTCDLGTAAIPFQTLYLNSNVAGPTNSRLADNIVSNAGASTSGNLASFSGATGKIVQDAAIIAANVVTNTGTATSGRVATFSANKVIQDGGTLLSDLATNAGVSAAYLAKSGGTMSGSINFGQNNATGFNYIQSGVLAGNVIWGSGTTITTPPGGNNLRNVYLGFNNDATGFAITLVGNECHQTVGAGVCNLIGSTLNVAGANSSAYGDTITITGNNSVAIGTNNTVPVSNGYVFGAGVTNSIANSMLLGSAGIVNIRANGTVCDLGTTAAPFRNLILNTGIESTAGLVIGPTTATSIAIGRAAITSTVNGIFATALPQGAWYSTTTYNPSFAAGVNRLTPPTAATAGTLVDFTHALGVLTYTGTRTRQFRIAYNITFTSGTTGSNMTFFNSIAASTVIGTQAQQKQQIFIQNSATQMCVVLLDNITLATGQTAQLAGACATLSAAVGYNFISCSISAMPN